MSNIFFCPFFFISMKKYVNPAIIQTRASCEKQFNDIASSNNEFQIKIQKPNNRLNDRLHHLRYRKISNPLL